MIPRFALSDNNILTVDNKPIHVNRFREWILSLLTAAETQMEVITSGHLFTDLDDYLDETFDHNNEKKWPLEDVRNQSPGYSFLTDKRNRFGEWKESLLRALIHEESDSPLVVINPDGSLRWDHGTLFYFLGTTSFDIEPLCRKVMALL